jgi:hypothetical protein
MVSATAPQPAQHMERCAPSISTKMGLPAGTGSPQ